MLFVLLPQPQASNDVFRGHTDHEAASLDTGAVVAVGAAAACGHIRLITVGTQTPEDALAQAQVGCGGSECSTHWGRDKMAAISQATSLNALSWMKMYNFDKNFTEVCS